VFLLLEFVDLFCYEVVGLLDVGVEARHVDCRLESVAYLLKLVP
jgi:hypothetical protein